MMKSKFYSNSDTAENILSAGVKYDSQLLLLPVRIIVCICDSIFILQLDENEKPNTFPSFRSWSRDSHSYCSGGIYGYVSTDAM